MPENHKRIRALPCWNGQLVIVPLKGGLSNESWRVTDAQGHFVVRFGRDYPFHHVLREREIMVARAANAAGFAPAILHAQPGVMVSRFLEAKTFDASDVRQNCGRIAELVHGFHQTMPRHVSGPGFMFWVFHVIRDYAITLETGNSRLKQMLARWLDINTELERVQTPLPIIFGHNDLLPANFLDDGKRLWLIDFEYAGFSTAMFDLAGIASNAGMDGEQSAALLAAYFCAVPDADIMRSHAAMQCASLLRETMWSLVSEIHLDGPGVDYIAYTAENLARLEQALGTYQSLHGKIAS